VEDDPSQLALFSALLDMAREEVLRRGIPDKG